MECGLCHEQENPENPICATCTDVCEDCCDFLLGHPGPLVDGLDMVCIHCGAYNHGKEHVIKPVDGVCEECMVPLLVE